MLKVENNSLTPIDELIHKEVENYIIPGKSIKGCIFFISCVYYRSSWKYQDRSLRYCFLDSDHHLGAIARSLGWRNHSALPKVIAALADLHNQDIQLIFNCDQLALDPVLDFEN